LEPGNRLVVSIDDRKTYPNMTSPTKNQKHLDFLKSKRKTSRIRRRGFEQLSSSIGWRVMVLHSSARSGARGT